MENNEDKLPDGVVHSTRIKAGKRTYFIDVKQTRQEDYFIAITESKKKTQGEKTQFFRNKVLVYKEDFNKILQGLTETIEFVKSDLMPDYDFDEFDRSQSESFEQVAESKEEF